MAQNREIGEFAQYITVNATANTVLLDVVSVSVGNSSGNTIVNSTALTVKSIVANGSTGTSGQVLTTNSTGVYWSTVTGGGGGSLSTFSANVGNGTGNTFTVTHDLNSTSLLFTTREISTGYIVYPDIKQTTTNACSVEFASPPSANQYVVLVVKVA